ncbi:MAG: spore germination protein GerW family protein [Candidatus Dormiibacterota bacterium]
MQPEDILNRVRDLATVRQVFGEPYERDGTLVVPVARILGGGGGGGGETSDPARGGRGWGGGFGVCTRPLGVYVIREGRVSWQPAVDVSRIVLQGQLVAIVAMLVVRGVVRRRRSRRGFRPVSTGTR